jgi:heat shock protein HslJ
MINPSNRRSRVFRGFRVAMVASLAALPLLSCSDGVTGPSDLMGGVWRLQSMEVSGGTSRFVPDDPSRFTIEFKADGVIGVRADCNSCGGTYTLRAERLSVPELACTLVACPTPEGGQFAALIDGETTLDKDDDDVLELESPDGRLVLER